MSWIEYLTELVDKELYTYNTLTKKKERGRFPENSPEGQYYLQIIKKFIALAKSGIEQLELLEEVRNWFNEIKARITVEKVDEYIIQDVKDRKGQKEYLIDPSELPPPETMGKRIDRAGLEACKDCIETIVNAYPGNQIFKDKWRIELEKGLEFLSKDLNIINQEKIMIIKEMLNLYDCGLSKEELLKEALNGYSSAKSIFEESKFPLRLGGQNTTVSILTSLQIDILKAKIELFKLIWNILNKELN